MIVSGTVTVPAFAVTVDVLGSFGVGYVVVGLVPEGWATGTDASALTASQFTVTFTDPAPSGGATLNWTVNTAAVQPASTGCVLAGALVTRLRSKIGDNVWVGGVAQPEIDGKFRVAELYGWMDDGAKTLTQLTGWTIDDWWAMPQVALQPWYDVDPKWVSMGKDAFSNQWPLNVVAITEGDTIWPNTLGTYSAQSLLAYVRRLAANLQVGVFPSPIASDPATTLVSGINASGDDPISLTSTTGFLTYGYVQIDDELIQYQQRQTGAIAVISRGVCGTTAATHSAGATVQHLGFWIKGKRLPADIANSQSCVEMPRAWMSHLETYVLAQCRFARDKHAEGMQLMAAWEKACRFIDGDPKWKVNVGQIRGWGQSKVGPVYGRSAWGVIVP